MRRLSTLEKQTYLWQIERFAQAARNNVDKADTTMQQDHARYLRCIKLRVDLLLKELEPTLRDDQRHE